MLLSCKLNAFTAQSQWICQTLAKCLKNKGIAKGGREARKCARAKVQ